MHICTNILPAACGCRRGAGCSRVGAGEARWVAPSNVPCVISGSLRRYTNTWVGGQLCIIRPFFPCA